MFNHCSMQPAENISYYDNYFFKCTLLEWHYHENVAPLLSCHLNSAFSQMVGLPPVSLFVGHPNSWSCPAIVLAKKLVVLFFSVNLKY